MNCGFGAATGVKIMGSGEAYLMASEVTAIGKMGKYMVYTYRAEVGLRPMPLK